MFPDISYAILFFGIVLLSMLPIAYSSLQAYCLIYHANNEAIIKFINQSNFPINKILITLSISRTDFSHYPDNILWHLIPNIIQRLFLSIFSLSFIIAIIRFILSNQQNIFVEVLASIMLFMCIILLIFAWLFGYNVKHYIQH